jgi:hypothetical protein
MYVSSLNEMDEYKMLHKIRELFPALQTEGSDLCILNKYLLKIIINAKFVSLRSYDPDADLNKLCLFDELERLKAEVKNKMKAFLIACHTLILDQCKIPEIESLKWNDVSPLKERYRDVEDFQLIHSEEEWRSLLSFRNALVLAVEVVKEKNKVLLEMCAGMLSNFNLCMSGGKPSRQVKRRHAIYHDETHTEIRPRRYMKYSTVDGYGENKGKKKKRDFSEISQQMSLPMLPPRPPLVTSFMTAPAFSIPPFPEPSEPFCNLQLLSTAVALMEKDSPLLSDNLHHTLMSEPYQGSFTTEIVQIGVNSGAQDPIRSLTSIFKQ